MTCACFSPNINTVLQMKCLLSYDQYQFYHQGISMDVVIVLNLKNNTNLLTTYSIYLTHRSLSMFVSDHFFYPLHAAYTGILISSTLKRVKRLSLAKENLGIGTVQVQKIRSRFRSRPGPDPLDLVRTWT